VSKAANTFKEELDQVRLVVKKLLINRESIKVLEVGCGSSSFIKLQQNAYMVGIDISEKQLQRNDILNEKILGDIQTYDLPHSEFDLIVCWWILEHLEYPEKALINCLNSLKENGIIVIAVPNVYSAKGLVTKYTPHWFHIWVYRYILGKKLAGIEDNPPFHTFLKFSISLDSVKKFAHNNKFSVEYFGFHESVDQKNFRENHRIAGPAWSLVKLLIKALSFGKVDAELTDLIVVLKNQKVVKDGAPARKLVKTIG
jgi:2-polyprenyl-3-methyl-5-hydroxy-6-metoxy-1,4-benzoquinol methylase